MATVSSSPNKQATRAAAVGAIHRDEVYSLKEFVARTGIGRHARRTLKHRLPVIKIGGRGFIRGSDFLALVDEFAATDISV